MFDFGFGAFDIVGEACAKGGVPTARKVILLSFLPTLRP